MIKVSILAMIGGSSGRGIEERPKLIVVSSATAAATVTTINGT